MMLGRITRQCSRQARHVSHANYPVRHSIITGQTQQLLRQLPRTSVRSASSEFGGKKDSGFNIMNFVVVALIGTGIFGVVVHRVDLQDSTKSMLKRKNTFTDQEWEQYMSSIKRKVLLFNPSVQVYCVPSPDEKKVAQLKSKIPNLKTVDLNDIIKDEIENHQERFGSLLSSHLVSSENGYQFNSRLASGIFTKLMRLRLEELKTPDANDKYLLLNYPNNLKELIKFESDVAVVKKLILFKQESNDISDYFDTVNKVSKISKIDDATISSLQS